MTDRELLELAAKAAGMKTDPKLYEEGIGVCWSGEDEHGIYIDCWNPLVDDAHALRLAVKLEMPIDYQDGYTTVWLHIKSHFIIESHEGDPYAATRRAVVRAAAEIGRAMG